MEIFFAGDPASWIAPALEVNKLSLDYFVNFLEPNHGSITTNITTKELNSKQIAGGSVAFLLKSARVPYNLVIQIKTPIYQLVEQTIIDINVIQMSYIKACYSWQVHLYCLYG